MAILGLPPVVLYYCQSMQVQFEASSSDRGVLVNVQTPLLLFVLDVTENGKLLQLSRRHSIQKMTARKFRTRAFANGTHS